MQENLVFGIDLGIASCGWAVLKMPDLSEIKDNLEVTPEGGEILSAGSWCFDAPEENKAGTPTPKNQTRRTSRLQRRVIRRRAQRMNAIRKLFYEHGLLPSAFSDVLRRPNYDPWELRAKGLDKALKPLEFALACAHIAKHRGFKSNAKNPAEESSDNQKMLKALEGTREHLKKYRTFGEMMARDPDYRKCKRNRNGIYNCTAARDDLAHEAHLLFQKQRELGQAYATEELEKAFMGKAFFQRPLQDSEKLLGMCRFEPTEKRAAKLAPSFELFRLLSKLATLRLTDNAPTEAQERVLTPEEIGKLLPHLGKTAKISVKKAKEIMGIPQDWSFTQFRSEEDEKLDIAARKGEAMSGTAIFRKVLGEILWHELQETPEILDHVAHNLSFFETQERIEEKIREQKLKPTIEEALLQALGEGKFIKFKAAGHISTKAARKLIPFLLQGKRYDEACSEAGYDHSDTQAQIQTKQDFKEIMKKRRAEIPNPVARKAFSEGMKQLWAMRQNWGLPGEIRIEVARDVGNSAKQREEIERDIKENTAQREREREEICGHLGLSDVNGETLLRYRLWKEQGGRCLYTDTKIDIRDLDAKKNNVQVDHILPWSRFGDDSYRNKTLCIAKANQEKKNRTPYEWLGGDSQRWLKFAECVNRCAEMKLSKKRLFLLQNATEREEGFRERNLNDTRYAARLFAQAASLLYAESDRGKMSGSRKRVRVRPGRITALLRRAWGLNSLKKDEKGERREDDRHHALDAMVIAATTEGALQRLTKACQREEERGSARMFGAMSEPWEGFREDVKDCFENILVARPERRRARGKLHDATIRSVRQRPGGAGEVTKVYERKTIKGLKEADLSRIKDAGRNQAMIAALREWIARGKPMEEEEKLPRVPAGHVIRKVRLEYKGKTGVILQTGLEQPYAEDGEQKGRPASANRGDMVRVDVFSQIRTKGKSAGKPEWFLVPVYPHELTEPEPPMRAVAGGKDEKDWPIMTEAHRFHFSLYPVSFVEVVKSDGEVITGYFAGLDRTVSAIAINTAKSKQITIRGIGAKTLASIKKYAVDRFGNKNEIKEERREWHGAAYISPNQHG